MDLNTPMAHMLLEKNYHWTGIEKDEKTNKTFIYFDTVSSRSMHLTPEEQKLSDCSGDDDDNENEEKVPEDDNDVKNDNCTNRHRSRKGKKYRMKKWEGLKKDNYKNKASQIMGIDRDHNDCRSDNDTIRIDRENNNKESKKIDDPTKDKQQKSFFAYLKTKKNKQIKLGRSKTMSCDEVKRESKMADINMMYSNALDTSFNVGKEFAERSLTLV